MTDLTPSPSLVPSCNDRLTRLVTELSRELTPTMKVVLLEHADGPIQIHHDGRHPTVLALVRKGLVRFDQYKPPRTTQATAAGRGAIGLLKSEEFSNA